MVKLIKLVAVVVGICVLIALEYVADWLLPRSEHTFQHFPFGGDRSKKFF